MGVDRFEDLHSWQEARKLTRLIYTLTSKPTFKKDFELSHQCRGAAVSSMGNIAEAHGRFSFEEKRNFYEISHGSVEEVQSHLYVALDQGYITDKEFREAYDCARAVGKLDKGSIDNLDSRSVRADVIEGGDARRFQLLFLPVPSYTRTFVRL